MSDSQDGCDEVISRILVRLNENQRLAVTAPANGRLQIIAGPGTGKTKVLVSRVAYLLMKEKIEPNRIIVTTFTKKAANEMIERLSILLNGQGVDFNKLIIGTFHSICFRILKIYGFKIDLQGFNVANERDSDQIIKEVLERLTSHELSSYIQDKSMFETNKTDKIHGLDVRKLKNSISKLKSNNILPDSYTQGPCNQFLNLIYTKYQNRLHDAKLFDFDDCLLYCYRLITTHPVLNFVEHVLVDEFQDTNEVQLQLMYAFAKGYPLRTSNNVTIVGDPDQSIYGFRNAQSKNFQKMKDYYIKDLHLQCQEIHLINNYRSTSDILNLSESIMRQQMSRIKKNLQSSAKTSFKPVHEILSSPEQEARWIAYQIEHLIALPNSPFLYSDISVIVRAANQTRVIENEFVRRRIPYLMIRGKAFWDRKEVVAILDYLRIVASKHDRIAFLRTLNFPKRGIGQSSMALIEELFDQDSKRGVLQFDTLKKLADGTNTSKIQGRLKLIEYLEFIQNARYIVAEVDNADESKLEQTVSKLFDFVYTESGLKKEFDESKEHQLNILEVKNQLCEFKPKEEELPAYLGDSPESVPKDDRSVLNKFLQSIGLYETQLQNCSSEKDIKSKAKVSISTIHGSKGLEWPVVFVPGLTDGLIPASFAMRDNDEESINEERRCFYVATTRPKTLLYLSSYTETEGKWGRPPMTEISRFLKESLINKFTTRNQLAFQNFQLLEKLYELLEVLITNHDKFNIEAFNKLYRERKKLFLQGADFDIIGYNYNIAEKHDAISGFVSAKQQLLRFSSVGLRRRTITKPALADKQGEKSKLNQSKLFSMSPSNVNPISCNLTQNLNKAPKLISANQNFSPRSKAPPYIPCRITKTKVVKKAPPYIPNRKS